MRHILIGFMTTTLLAATALFSQANDPIMQPGLWSMQVLEQTIDGKPTPLPTAAMSANAARMQAAMASMPAEQRARMAAVMSQVQNSFSPDGSIKVCLTPAMVSNNMPMLNPRNQSCKPAHMQRQGNHVHYDLSCQQGTQSLSGSGDSQISSNVVESTSNFTSTGPTGTHHIHSSSRMRFVSSDCGSVRPMGTQ